MREKLFDLMMRDPCPSPVICNPNCEYYKSHHCHAERYADHLIANGVTFATDNNVGHKWIPVTERLPEKDKEVLCLLGDGECWVAVWDHCDDGLWTDGEWWRAKNFVTHWMPLPEPPKEVE